MNWQIRLVILYVYVCTQFDKDLWVCCQRFTNNNQPEFTDEEVITVFLFGIMQRRFELRGICNYAHDHLSDWFPGLPSYVAFVNRINRLSDFFQVFTERILSGFSGTDMIPYIRLPDSFPVVMADGRRSSGAKAARELADKGRCASKGIWYYGVKVHILGIRRIGTLPIPGHIGITPASVHDLTAFRQIMPCLGDCQVYAGKAYVTDEADRQLLREQGTEILTPVKKKKGQKTLGLSEKLFSKDVSGVRQPVESLFNRIQEKTDIEIASKVRSYKGLMVHVFGRPAAAMFMLVFNP